MLVVPERMDAMRWRDVTAKSNPDNLSDIENLALPLLINFPGFGAKSNSDELEVDKLRRLVEVPFVLVSAVPERLPWWMLSSYDVDWGRVDGEFVPAQVNLWSSLIARLLAEPGIDEDSCSLLGFSSGAYAVTELLSASGTTWRPRAVALSDIRGHGQSQVEGLSLTRLSRAPEFQRKWRAYVERLSSHMGASTGIFAVHSRDDKVCPLSSAVEIFEALGRRQHELGLPDLQLDVVDAREVKNPGLTCAGNCHDRTLYREALVNRLLPTRLRSRKAEPTPWPMVGMVCDEKAACGNVDVGPVADRILYRADAKGFKASCRQMTSSSVVVPPRRKRSRTPEKAHSLRGWVVLFKSMCSGRQASSLLGSPPSRNRSRTPRRT